MGVMTTILILLPHLQGYVISMEQPSAHLRTVEHLVEMGNSWTKGYQELQTNKQRRIRGTSIDCSQRLDNMLRSCEVAAATPVPSPTPAAATDATPLQEQTVEAPLYFCGANCSHLAFLYAAECSWQHQFLINVTGACKLAGTSLTLECIYAVVMLKQGITACTRVILDVESTHDNRPLFDPSKSYVQRQCCSLETSYSTEVPHEVHVDRMGNPITEPPLEPPWLLSNSSEYQPLVDITSTDLCVAPDVTTTTTTEVSPTMPNFTASDSSSESKTHATTSSAHTSSLHSVCRLYYACMSVLICLYTLRSL